MPVDNGVSKGRVGIGKCVKTRKNDVFFDSSRLKFEDKKLQKAELFSELEKVTILAI